MAKITNKMKNLKKMKITIKNGETANNGETGKPVSRKILLERLNRFYQCRDFELSHLWQRSVFLGAFLVLVFSGYGYMLISKWDKIIEIKKISQDYMLLHFIAVGLAFTGIIISILWIMMGKSSKAWYEVYESRICDIEARKEMGIEENYRMGVYGSEAKTINSSLLSKKGGKYSPSKINIAIGQFSLALCFLIGTAHIWCLIADMSPNTFFDKDILLSCMLFFFFIFVVAEFLKDALKSTNL